MKRFLMIPLSVILALNVGCSTAGSNLFSVPAMESGRVVIVDKQEPVQADAMENLDKVISDYLADPIGYKSIEGTVFEAHELYGTQRIDGKLYAYLWSFTQEYVFENNKLVSGSGVSMPVVVILEEDKDGQYTAVGFKTPKDGAQYVSSIKELFPAEYQEKILTRTGANGLEQLVEQKALNYFRKAQNETATPGNPSDIKLEQQVTTSGYSLDVPKDWTVEKRSDDSLLFKKGGKVTGGLDILMHYSNQPISSLFPNHSEVTEQKEIEGLPAKAYMAVMKLSQPAASGDETVVEQLHYYFLVGEFAYDLYFNTSEVDRGTALTIAGTFRMLEPASDSVVKDGDILDGTGTYSGQIDNSSIEIGMDSAAGEPSYNAFRFSDDAAKKFETLGLRTGDKVKISYFRNGYDQLVITDILKVSK